jgi:hypothetical protein
VAGSDGARADEARSVVSVWDCGGGPGFRVERLQAAFPDCEAKREVAPGKWDLVLVSWSSTAGISGPKFKRLSR